ncbi:site-2 protease family protein [Streptomyces fulvoviolaceus]|uniref:site-2 protease family protein n=1 Tax=Streptomyces fulvoviolaceus TaxID=285535 RepID=UPI0021BF767A|nr:site-2 protease family protein [Streptomyces fulvoviolaceus]MCT9078425.1 site-2 protease family protein [Streptomyces fulvoviolaceus]
MDESGGSGQPRSGTDKSAEHHARPAASATDPDPHGNTTPHLPDEHRPAPAADQDPTGNEDRTATPEPDSKSPASTTAPETPAHPTAPNADTAADSADATPSTPSTDDAASDRSPGGPESPASDGPADSPAGRPDASPSADPAEASDPASHRPAPGDHQDRRPFGDHQAPHPDDHRTLAHAGVTKGRPPQRPPEPRGGLLMGRPFGVPVYVAPSWFLVAALITWVFGGQLDRVLPELGAARYLVSLFFAVAFYASVLVHELAHTVAALRFKLPVRRIQLQFFGGVSEIEKEAETPGREFVLAFVGPLLSLVLAGLFYLALQPVQPGTVPGVLLAGLMISNLIVAAFNLLPGLPLDGGRMLRAVVWKITGRPMTGTIAAAWVGRALAVTVLIGLPLLTQSGALGSNAEDNVGMDTVMDALLAAILAAIIWTGAGNSLRMARLREHLPELRARTLTRRAVPVETDTPLSEALRRANAAGARALVVVDADGNPLSLVREAAIVGVPEHRRPWVSVSGLAQDLTDGMRVSAELAGEDLLDTLRATPATEYLVVEETGEIYGVLSAADVERAFVKAMARPS